MPRKFKNRIYGIGKDAYVYKGTNNNFTRDSMLNYSTFNQQFYYNPQMFNYTNPMAPDYFMGMNGVNHLNVNMAAAPVQATAANGIGALGNRGYYYYNN